MTRCSEYKSWINSHSLSYLGRYRAALAAKKDQSRNRQPQQPLLGEARILWGDQRVGGPKKGHKCWTLRDFGSFCFLRLKVGDQNRFLGPGPKGSHILFKAMLIAIKHLWRSSLQSGETLRVIRSLPNPCIFPWQLFPTMRRPNRIKQKNNSDLPAEIPGIEPIPVFKLMPRFPPAVKKISLCLFGFQ